MRTSSLVRLVLSGPMAAAVTGLFAQTAPNASSAPVEQTVELPTFTVSSERGNEYRATDSMSAARIRGALIDTPATVNVITDDFLKDIGAASLFDATQYISGIGNGRLGGGSGILDRQTIRGYENDGRTIDNFSSSFQGNLDPLLYERVEIVKGPVDDLDDAALMPAFGGKMGIDATRKGPAEGVTREWPKRLVTSAAAASRADALWQQITRRNR